MGLGMSINCQLLGRGGGTKSCDKEKGGTLDHVTGRREGTLDHVTGSEGHEGVNIDVYIQHFIHPFDRGDTTSEPNANLHHSNELCQNYADL